MTNIKSYDDVDIHVVQATSEPEKLIVDACNMTQKRDISFSDYSSASKLIEFLVTANHTSPLEHAIITFRIQNVSRSFLAQITRHRMGSFTAGSQHYTKYDKFPSIIDPNMVTLEGVSEFLERANEVYSYCIASGIPKEEARQVLPNAKAVNILWTINARSLINFLNQRLCRRNVTEMYNFAIKLEKICSNWFPMVFYHVGPDCEMYGGCTQGYMQAQECKEGRYGL